MGCGCKSKNKDNSKLGLKEPNNLDDKLTLKGKILKLPLAIGLSVLFICASPFLVVYIWYLFMEQIFTNKMLLFSFLKKFKKEDKVKDDTSNLEDVNPDEYVLMDVDKVK